jgi:hypothetical protein
MHGSRRKIPRKNPVRQRCAEGFNSGVKGLMTVALSSIPTFMKFRLVEDTQYFGHQAPFLEFKTWHENVLNTKSAVHKTCWTQNLLYTKCAVHKMWWTTYLTMWYHTPEHWNSCFSNVFIIYMFYSAFRKLKVKGVMSTSVYTGRFQFLHCCYFVWEKVQFFSDCFICCCKPDIFLLLQLAQWFWWAPQHKVRNVHQLLTVTFRRSPTSFAV